MSAEAVVEVEGLVTYWGERRVLKGIDLTVCRREILVVMGSSGAGKSTLLNHLLGLLWPAEGCVRLFGQDLFALSPLDLLNLRRRIGVAFQSGALFSSLSVLDNILLPLEELTRQDRAAMEAVAGQKLELVSLGGFGQLMPAELSGGMIKRAAFARAIVLDPELLFCDEPSSGLDPAVAASIDHLILRLRDVLGMTIIVVTHDLESAFTIADRICVLDDGRVIALGTRQDIEASDHPRVQNLLNRRSGERPDDPDDSLRRRRWDW
jgi:phospholipid/cholesterol/gamma-HCH transport system ATP-binding protein